MNSNIQEDNKYFIIDLFAGAGGMSNGFEQTGCFKTIGAVELNQSALKTFINNHSTFAGLETFSDIKKVDFSKVDVFNSVPKKDLIVIGGPPCQGFSNANRQRNNLISGNNQLVKEYVRAIRQLKPAAFVMENVKTIKSDKHKFFVTNGRIKLADGEVDIFSTEEYLTKELGVEIENTSLTLIRSSNKSKMLENILHIIVEEQNEVSPIISGQNNSYLSQIRSLHRRLSKSNYIQAKNKIEARVFERMSEVINMTNSCELIAPVIRETALILDKLSSGARLFASDIKEVIETFMSINHFLLCIKELQGEDIKYKLNKPVITKGVLTVSAEVKSYNVLDYVLKSLEKEGYIVKDMVLNATDYGVPQKRNRFFLIGINTNAASNDINIKEPSKIASESFTVYDAFASLIKYMPGKDVKDNIILNISIEERIKTNSRLEKYYTEGYKNTIVKNHINTESKDMSIRRFESLDQGQNFHDLSDDLKSNYTDTSRTQNTVYLRLKHDEPSRTVVNVRKSMWIHPEYNRSISIREAARLQTFPDSFEFFGKKDEQYQQIGNAVPPLLARAVAEKILELLNKKPKYPIGEVLNQHLEVNV
ncbi:DNA cytosine methyltransferase [Bacillus benzoevorans]|uniref:DNA (cytosine-5-)-methyltransferase n=1 Tax=Bacillus benzoevorans TaxID=1456 RepID=A0A7X0HVX1_9BACI|nr:DNA cytosine methyltransferase [Bacillus benzoevorans]MBB6447798.1 DNA (cytosine-5)-methyltransferase 1 [Bacillus benzoevorans]